MLINELNRINVESALLGAGRNFSDEQIAVINSDKSINIMACPGSGKTTVLTAKIALLLEKIINERVEKGICIITHTNVAVEEIINSLAKLGISNVSYPHFIGTIHDFFNTFFSLKAYNLYTNKDKYYLMENDEYKAYFSKFFERNKPTFWSVNTPVSAVDRTEIKIDDKNNLTIISKKRDGSNYHKSVPVTFHQMFNKGFIRHSDTIQLAHWYIRKNKEAIKNAFQSRFKYMFIDEAQDTSIEQFDSLKMLTDDSEIICQWYGDSYQALYSLYGKEDAWMPSLENTLQINYSNRFGENIAKVLRTTCIEEYKVLKANNSINSFSPHLFIYNDHNKKEILKVYSLIVSELKRKLSSNQVKGKVAAVCHHHDSLEGYYDTYQRTKSNKPLQSELQALTSVYNRVLTDDLRLNDDQDPSLPKKHLKNLTAFLNDNYLSEYIEIKSYLSQWVMSIKTSIDDEAIKNSIFTSHNNLIKKILNKSYEAEIDISNMETIRFKIINILESNNINELSQNIFQDNTSNIEVELNTIHGVKGETHFSTLLLESIRDDISDIQQIINFLTGRYIPELIDIEPLIRDTLKLAYVALSRPRYFAGVAIHENNILKEDIANAEKFGWEIVRINDYHDIGGHPIHNALLPIKQ
ncbi:UvrD-helicase domain-containing protein [Paenibacillus septentrionalis]|uniref:UvrD-helicase domain-containing protein n=1 Tax=Paenibacillus septentrionalis TaxID=429342 RepID=A0ABW1UXT3_9BACL